MEESLMSGVGEKPDQNLVREAFSVVGVDEKQNNYNNNEEKCSNNFSTTPSDTNTNSRVDNELTSDLDDLDEKVSKDEDLSRASKQNADESVEQLSSPPLSSLSPSSDAATTTMMTTKSSPVVQLANDTNNNNVRYEQQQTSTPSLIMSASKLVSQANQALAPLSAISINTRDVSNPSTPATVSPSSSGLKVPGDGNTSMSVHASNSSHSMISSGGEHSNELTMMAPKPLPSPSGSTVNSISSHLSILGDGALMYTPSSSSGGSTSGLLEQQQRKSMSSPNSSSGQTTPTTVTPNNTSGSQNKSGGSRNTAENGSPSSSTSSSSTSQPANLGVISATSTSSSSSSANSAAKKVKTPTSGSKSNKRPWYSAFINTYKQKNEDFRRLFKLSAEEHLLVDYSCALQREILAHGRLYVSLNYVCFRANIIGWETTLIIKLRDIRSIYKDKTAKIIPNAISIVLDNEKYFFTSFISRDKTYATIFRIWQIALADSLMSNEEIDTILKSCYGEDLGYNSDDAEYEYYSKLKDNKSTIIQDVVGGAVFTTTDYNLLNKSSSFNAAPHLLTTVINQDTSSAREIMFSDTETGKSSSVTSGGVKFDTSSFSDDQSNLPTRANHHKAVVAPKSPTKQQRKGGANENPMHSSSFSPFYNPASHSHPYHVGHRQSSSFDTAMIDTSDQRNSSDAVADNEVTQSERPRSMVVGKPAAPHYNYSLQKVIASQTSSNSVGEQEFGAYVQFNLNETSDENKILESFSFSSKMSPTSPVAIATPAASSPNDRSDSSSSSMGDGSLDESSASPLVTTDSLLSSPQSGATLNTKCSCGDHQGKEMLNQVYTVTVNYLWECLFGHTTFCRNYWESRKFGNIKVGDWKMVNGYPFRQLEYTVDLGGAIGRPKNTEEQRILEYRPDECIVLESESFTHGVPYSDYFTTRNRFCMTKVSPTTTRLCIHSFLNFIQRPNFIAKNFIERHCMGALRDSYNYLATLITSEYLKAESLCHEDDSAKASRVFHSFLRTPTTTTITNVSKQQQNRKSSRMSTIASSIIESTVEFDPNGNSTEEIVSSEFLKEKNIPAINVPSNSRLPANISALQGDTAAALKLNHLRGNSTTTATANLDTAQSAASVDHHHHNHHHHHAKSSESISPDRSRAAKHHHHQQSIISNASQQQQQQQQQKLITNLEVTTSPQPPPLPTQPGMRPTSKKKRLSQQTSTVDDTMLTTANMLPNGVATAASSHQFQTQLVPIQKFSFFKWEINVDTLVRLFIVARIESLADSLRSDPNIVNRLNNPERQFESVLLESSSTSANIEKESNDWRMLISKTLDAIEKMETSLRQWDKTLESRANQQAQTPPPPKIDL